MFSVMSIKSSLAYFILEQATVICDRCAGGMFLIAREADWFMVIKSMLPVPLPECSVVNNVTRQTVLRVGPCRLQHRQSGGEK